MNVYPVLDKMLILSGTFFVRAMRSAEQSMKTVFVSLLAKCCLHRLVHAANAASSAVVQGTMAVVRAEAEVPCEMLSVRAEAEVPCEIKKEQEAEKGEQRS